MRLRITDHAKERAEKYEISKKLIRKGIENPDNVVNGHSNRRIAQKKLNEHVLRIIFEEEKDTSVVITLYKARRERYEI